MDPFATLAPELRALDPRILMQHPRRSEYMSTRYLKLGLISHTKVTNELVRRAATLATMLAYYTSQS